MKLHYFSFLKKSMLKNIFVVLPVFFIFCSCSGDKSETENKTVRRDSTIIESKIPTEISLSDSIKGDFNGDGKAEYAWLVPVELDSLGSCGTHCDCLIKFSEKSLPEINLGKDIYGGNIVNQGDLNDKGADELSVVTAGDASEWSLCFVYSFKNEKWTQPVKAFSVFGIGGDYVEKDSLKKGNVIISEFESAGKLKTKSVKIE